MAEDIDGDLVSVPGDPGPGGVFPDPPLTDQDLDLNSNMIGDSVSASSPFWLGIADYVFPFGDIDAIDFDTTLIIGDPSMGAGFDGNMIYGNENGIVLEVGAATRQNVTVRNNDIGGNRALDFLTGTVTNTIATQSLSVNRGEGSADDVLLDPLAHLHLFFGDMAGGPTAFNEGNTLLPLTTGGTWTAGDAFKGAGRDIIPNFQVVVPNEVFPPGGPDNIFIDAAGVDQDEAAIFLFNGYNFLPGIGTIE
ncbi:MAG: hypothetical protein DWQ34_09470 [Planctomycetota bacterium]|nr:MAG: hypothetical protein DWQ34_09470 [Planctomycetota bacterium]